MQETRALVSRLKFQWPGYPGYRQAMPGVGPLRSSAPLVSVILLLLAGLVFLLPGR